VNQKHRRVRCIENNGPGEARQGFGAAQEQIEECCGRALFDQWRLETGSNSTD
jgi:hypothetical protein